MRHPSTHIVTLLGDGEAEGHHHDGVEREEPMTYEQKREHLKMFEAGQIPPSRAALWKRGASNAGGHDPGCAKTFALMRNAFADTLLQMR
jgi:hypothetical protein